MFIFLENIFVGPPDITDISSIMVVIILLIISALISGSEVAFFSLTPSEIGEFNDKLGKNDQLILNLLKSPEKLLATILITNNFVNVGIVILSSFVSSRMFYFGERQVLGFIFQVVLITFLLLLFGEIVPKVYASKFASRFASIMAYPLNILSKIFSPLSILLIRTTSIINRRFQKKPNLSIDDLSDALDITGSQIKEDRKILKGIVRFGNIDVKEIMKSRVDIVAIEYKAGFNKLLSVIIESSHSRIPVYEDNFDNIKGVLYIKDLLPFINEDDNFEWQKLLRNTYFVPESKMIDDLLKEFQTLKRHMAVVVDEYGGTSGIVTLEDILEEIVGEITDELDEDDVFFKKLDENKFLFEGKTLLNDFYKIVKCEDDIFSEIKGDSETLAGLILEYKGEIPEKYVKIKILNFDFIIKSVDNRRIKQIEVTINKV